MEKMTVKSFAEYMANNLDGYQTFYMKAMEFQKKKNDKRAAKSRWNEYKLEKAVNEMWVQAMTNLFNQIKPNVKDKERYLGKVAWYDYIQEKNLFETLNESLTDIEFEEEWQIYKENFVYIRVYTCYNIFKRWMDWGIVS